MLLIVSAALPGAHTVPCPPGEPVKAFFVGSIDLGNGPEDCKATMEACYFGGAIASGPEADGHYMINWEDGDPNNRRVHSSMVKQLSSGQACNGPAAAKGPAKAPPQSQTPPAGADDDDENWVPPEIPCTLLPRLHWEGSDPKWNKEAVEALRGEFKPDELIDGFDWHVILRFNDVNRCEAAYQKISGVLAQCGDDQEKCFAHKYVKAIEYVGDDPETRRKTGRHVFTPEAGRQEL